MPSGRAASPFMAASRQVQPPAVNTALQQDGRAKTPEEEELDRQERIRLDTYTLGRRTASCEAHGILQVEPLPSPNAAALPSHEAQQLLQQQREHQRQQQIEEGFASGSGSEPVSSSLQSADVNVELQPRDYNSNTALAKLGHVADGDAARQVGDAEDPGGNKVQEIMEPITADSGRPPLVLGFSQLSVWAPVNPKKASIGEQAWKAITCRREDANPKRQILFDVAGEVRPGEVLALMGPSGSGKTTLLTVLGGRSAMDFKGQVVVNGAPFTKATRRRVGFVLQDDVLYDSLTVKETLTYAALLRLPKTMSRTEKTGRVEQVIDALGLRKSKDTIIGGFFRRGISGGERKRVSIGHELLINPAILLLDEPTSGLDSTTAMHLLTLLQDLAVGGRSIATTIHQPSSRLYQKLDWLMLLAEGHMMYYGKADQVLDWFGQFGYKIPFGVSIADYILDISLGEAGYSSSGLTGSAAIKEVYEAYESQFAGQVNQHKHAEGFSYQIKQEHENGAAVKLAALPVSTVSAAAGDGCTVHFAPGPVSVAANGGSGVDSVRQSRDQMLNPAQRSSADRKALGGDSSSSGGGGVASGSRDALQQEEGSGGWLRKNHVHHQGASYLEQLRVLAQRAGRVRRFEQMTGQHFFQLFAVAFITGLVWWQRGQAYYGGAQAISDVLGLLFFMLLFPAMRALFRALFTFPNEYRLLMKERPSGMYNLSAYYLARTAADIPNELLNTVLFVVIAYWFGGLRHTAAGFFGLLFSLVLVVAVGESWGLLIGGVFMEAKTAQTVTTVLILAFLLVGGYYVRNIPVWIGWLRWFSFLYWGFNLLLKTQFSGVTYYSCGPGGACAPVPWSSVSLPVNPDEPAYPDVLILIGMLIFLRLVIYYVLRRKTRVKQKNIR